MGYYNVLLSMGNIFVFGEKNKFGKIISVLAETDTEIRDRRLVKAKTDTKIGERASY